LGPIWGHVLSVFIESENWLIDYYGLRSSHMRKNISGARNPITTEPNQALQRMNMLVTDCAPSSTLCAKHVHRWALTLGKKHNAHTDSNSSAVLLGVL
jgi:hypothetical protein